MIKPKDYTAKVCLGYFNGEETKVIRVENNNDVKFICETDIKSRTPANYITGPIADRLYDFESLGYEPEELKRIITLYKAYRRALDACSR